MIRKSIVMLRVAVLFLFAIVSLLSSAAWLANFRYPFAVLQTIGLVDKGAVVGEKWGVEWLLHEDAESATRMYFHVQWQTLTLDKTVYYPTNPGPTDYRGMDFGPINYRRWGNDSRRGSFRSSEIKIALWLLWPLFGVWPIWAFVHGPFTHWHRRKHGCCLNCGYSLTGLTEPRCPECGHGTVLAPATTASIPVSPKR